MVNYHRHSSPRCHQSLFPSLFPVRMRQMVPNLSYECLRRYPLQMLVALVATKKRDAMFGSKSIHTLWQTDRRAETRIDWPQLEQTVRFPIPHTMALPSGIYTIENVRYRNWAMLSNANEGDVVAGSSAGANVGEKVRTSDI
jgi:hypothetical protein